VCVYLRELCLFSSLITTLRCDSKTACYLTLSCFFSLPNFCPLCSGSRRCLNCLKHTVIIFMSKRSTLIAMKNKYHVPVLRCLIALTPANQPYLPCVRRCFVFLIYCNAVSCSNISARAVFGTADASGRDVSPVPSLGEWHFFFGSWVCRYPRYPKCHD